MTARARPKDQKPREGGPWFWRISSTTRRNVELAFGAGQWGLRRAIGVRALRPGDGVVFYVSQGAHAGYLGIARVTSKPFRSQKVIWAEGLYPVRFSLAPNGPLRPEPVKRDAVMARLGRPKLKYFRQAGVIRLTAEEYRTIARLLRGSSVKGRATTLR
jgi:hypothetical protein